MDETTEPGRSITRSATVPGIGGALALVLIWSRDEPQRAGEVLVLPPGAPGKPAAAWTFGRDEARPAARSIGLVRQRPGRDEATGALASPRISRAQLRLSHLPGGPLLVENVGKCPLVHHDLEVTRIELGPGDVVELRHELVFLCVSRPRTLPALAADHPVPLHAFGAPDAFGLVGEGPAIWELRRGLAALAARPVHVLVSGPSGAGKELAARAIHAWSARRQRPLVARNAATLPEGLIDAELFGHARNFPNPGTPERPGLIGEAHGGTLFLDEFAELPLNLQAHLLRVLDEGEYHRLGEARARRADLRLIAASNRPEQALKHDLLARLKGRLALPGLDAQREDIPLLAAHLLRAQGAHTAAVRSRFFPDGDLAAAPRTSPELMTALVEHRYRTHLRELDGLLLRATIESHGKYLELTDGVRRGLATPAAPAGPAAIEIAAPVASGPLEAFDSDEQRRIALFRKHAWSAAACGRDPDYGSSRQTADLHLRQLMGRALAMSGWDIAAAVARLAGDDEAQRSKLQSRLEAFLLNLRHRLEADGPEALRQALASEWRGAAPTALRLLEALESRRLHGARQ